MQIDISVGRPLSELTNTDDPVSEMSIQSSSGSGPSGIGGGIFKSLMPGTPRAPSYHEILPRLYLGDINTATNKNEMTRLGITDMITIEIKPVEPSELASCIKRYLFINVMDHSKQDILSHLDTSYEFIDSALKVPSNKVYVHCVAGISRSASLVIAYVMKSHSLTYSEAFELVSQKRPVVVPNEGFAKQLVLYHKMGYAIDIANLDYRKMVLEALVFEFRLVALSYYQVHMNKTSGSGISAVLTTTTASIVHLPPGAHRNLASRSNIEILFDQYYSKLHLQEVNKYPHVYNPTTAYRCCKCRAIVFYAISVIENKPSPAANDTFASADGASGRVITPFGKGAKECPFVFIEPQPWMNKRVLEREGNLECYKCKQKLGKFDWTSGESCSCDSHNSHMNVNLFKIKRKKVDAGSAF